VNDRRPTIAVVSNNDIITIACVMMPPIAVMVSNPDAYANWSNTDICILSMCGKHDCNSNSRKQSNRHGSHLSLLGLPDIFRSRAASTAQQ
jgi:hypothetical protein